MARATELSPSTSDRSPAGGWVVEVSGLRKVYSKRKVGPVVAVDGVSFNVAKGELLGLLGPNGAGKTTTIKSVCTLIHPTEGSIVINGVDAIRHPRQATAHLSAVLEGNRNIYWRLTTRENLELFAGLYGLQTAKVRPLIDELIERFELGEKANTEARQLSRGMQQKLAVACAFVKQTPVLLLDEPTLGLDVETSHELRVALRQMVTDDDRTIILSSHDMAVVQDVCERVIIINKGRIVTDDRVGNLLDLFRARAYTFTLTGPLGADAEASLRRIAPVVTIEALGAGCSLRVELTAAGQIYQIVDALRDAAAEIESIDHEEPDLEEIFLKLVRG